MSDDIDATEIREQHLLNARISQVTDKAYVNIVGSGICDVCGNEVEAVLCHGRHIVGRWCSVECRDRGDL